MDAEGRRAAGWEGTTASWPSRVLSRSEASPVNIQHFCSPATTHIQLNYSFLNLWKFMTLRGSSKELKFMTCARN